MTWLAKTRSGFRLAVLVVPGASRTEIAGVQGEALKIRVAAPPEGGRANEAVAALLADRLGLPRRAVRLARGATSRHKIFEIDAPPAGTDPARTLLEPAEPSRG